MADQLPLSPTTTEQQDITTAGQRRINMIWEITQAMIAILVVTSSLGASLWAMIHKDEVPALLAFLCGNVVGFYFSRTNHAAIGGVGRKPVPEHYDGR